MEKIITKNHQNNYALMKYRQLGVSDLEVSIICLGTMTFGNPVKKKEAIDLIHWCLDVGINFIDTADIYEGYDRHLDSSGGVSEKIIGHAIKGKRENVILTTKVGNSVGGKYKGSGLNKAHIEHQITKSLDHLQTDYIDIYQMHKPDTETPLEESIGVFQELIKSGKIRYWGISNFDAYQLSDILKVCETNNWQKPIVSQSPYSWLNRQLEKDLIPLLESNNIALTPYRILEGGLLTGKYWKAKNLNVENRLKNHPSWVTKLDYNSIDMIEDFELKANEMKLSPAQYAAQWLLMKKVIPSILVGVRNKKQLEPFLNLKID